MTKTDPPDWISSVRNMLYFYLRERAERRCAPHEIPQKGAETFHPSWVKVWRNLASELYYRLRSARTRRLFADCFTHTLCSIPQGALHGENLHKIADLMRNEQRWEDLRDVMMLCLSSTSYISQEKVQKEDQ
ncbi:MAG: hypothetical protein KC800_07250 [Candidatus Eremiobacteraeota bacterium]|nr:hypothetical protein [Candidatus Eremiobacteraeota bacterium]